MKAFVIAGEPSGDKLGAALIAGLRALEPGIRFEGVGGTQMREQGLSSLFPMDELSLMGIAEILPKYFHLKRRIRQTADAILAAQPDVLITIDSPDFCLRVARLVRAASSIRTVHYVAPTVWAWRPGRAAKMARHIDQVLALFPFEPPLMQEAGMECDFVGHPVVAEPDITQAEREAFTAKYNLAEGPHLVILPGSRRSELERLGPIFDDAYSRIAPDFPEVIIPTLPHLTDQLKAVLPLKTATRCHIVTGEGLPAHRAARERLIAMTMADQALAASGTVSLELAAAQTPMVIAYDMSWLSRKIISRMLLTDTVTLVNLVSETRAVPEFIGENCKPEALARALKNLQRNSETQLDALRVTMQRLGKGGEAPGLRAARAILNRL